MSAALEVLRCGQLSIQDKGRPICVPGVPCSGAMDQRAYKLANQLVGNDESQAVIEWSILAPRIKCLEDVDISITGAPCEVKVNDTEEKMNKRIHLKSGDLLNLKSKGIGNYGYIALSAEIDAETANESVSFHPLICPKNRFNKGEIISASKFHNNQESSSAKDVIENEEPVIKVYPGPEWQNMKSKSQERLKNEVFHIGRRMNRMAIEIQEQLEHLHIDLLSMPVLPGCIQLTPSGRMYALHRDAQSSGGYPRILIIEEDSLSKFAQIPPGGQFRFEFLSNA